MYTIRQVNQVKPGFPAFPELFMLSFSLSDEIVIPAQLRSGSMLTTSKEFDKTSQPDSSDHNHIHAFWCGLSVLFLTDMMEVVVINCRFCLYNDTALLMLMVSTVYHKQNDL